MRAPAPTTDQMRAIRRDYAAKDETGRYLYSLEEVASRNGVTAYTVNTVRKAWGLSRYLRVA